MAAANANAADATSNSRTFILIGVCLSALCRSVEHDLPLIPERKQLRIQIELDRRDRWIFGRALRNPVRCEISPKPSPKKARDRAGPASDDHR